MKNRLFILLILLLIIPTSCTNKDELAAHANTKVKTTISDITNINEQQIKESYIYIRDNYEKQDDEKIYESLLYHVKYLQSLGKYSKKNDLTILANKTSNYLKKDNTKNKKEVKKMLSIIDGDEEELIKEIYDNYLKLNIVKKIMNQQTKIATSDAKDKNMITETNINKALNYLNKHSQNPFKNDEVLEKTIYYSLYLKKLGKKDNDITKSAQYMINYLSTLKVKEKQEAITLLNNIAKNQSSNVKTFYNEIIHNE